jgi:hypothetical protein
MKRRYRVPVLGPRSRLSSISGVYADYRKLDSKRRELSGLPILDWFAAKEFTENNKPFFHMYVEVQPEALASNAISSEILREHLKVYFKYVDSDYNDLKRLLGIEPLEISIVRCGTFAEYQRLVGRKPRRINPRLPKSAIF